LKPCLLRGDQRRAGVVGAAATALNLDPTLASYGSVDEVYLKVLGRDILAEPSLTFARTD
jgi:hypothetical protein